LHKGGGTLLGGQVGANPNLSGRTASLILNEVTRTGNAFASRLAGPLEVFGAPAALVIANPNGITCAGCGFVNTAQLTLTTGLPQFLNAPGGAASSFESAAALGFDAIETWRKFLLSELPIRGGLSNTCSRSMQSRLGPTAPISPQA
jgi:filamentous hemagglutinin